VDASLKQIETIRASRLLLVDPDPVAPLRGTLADVLRQSLSTSHDAQQSAYKHAMENLVENPTWQKIPAEVQTRILAEVGLQPTIKVDVSSDNSLIAVLDTKDLAARRTEAEAVPARVEKALQHAAQFLEPKVQFIALERSVLKGETDVEGWLARQRVRLLAALKSGPVQIQ
jgi:hypothetical protein